MTLNKDDPEPLRYYDWIGWKLRQELKKNKQTDMQYIDEDTEYIDDIYWNKNALDYGKTFDYSDNWKEVSKQLNRIEVKLDHILARLDGGLK